jgi:AcrR family transcriptional regulator
MARPRSDNRRDSILSATTQVIATHGLTASTANIAKVAGVSNGSLFVYFDTKATLLNALFILLKSEMGAAAISDLSSDSDSRDQVRHMWDQWVRWATTNPDKRRALAHLEVAEEITAETHQSVREAQAGMAEVLERARAGGPTQSAPIGFILLLATSLADTTMDAMIRDPAEAEAYSNTAFEAVWRVLAGTSTETDQ